MMNVFSLNCRGLKDHRRLQTIVNNCIRKLSDLDNLCMCLQETKISNLSNNHLKILAHYHLSYILYPADGQSGGLLTIFPKNFTVLGTHKSPNTISIHFSQHTFTLTNIYIKPTDYHLQQFLSDILAIEQFHCETHILCGDFNALPSVDCTSSCHVANNDFRLIRYHRILDILHNLQVVRVEPHSSMAKFTHFDKRTSSASQIDHFFTSQPHYVYNTTKISFSDHALLSLEVSNVTMTSSSYWKLNDNALIHHDYITSIIFDTLHSSHNSNNFDVQHYDRVKIKMRDHLRALCIFLHKQALHEERYLNAEILKLEHQISNNDVDPVLIKQLSALNSQLMNYQSMRAKKDFKQIKHYFTDCHHGDSHSVKKLICSRRQKSNIESLDLPDGSTTSDIDNIFYEFHHHFSQRFTQPIHTTSQLSDIENLLQPFLSTHSSAIQANIAQNTHNSQVTEQEVEEAIKKLNSDSAPGLDGLTSNFYKAHANFFTPYLTNIFNLMISHNWVPDSFTRTVIKLIPKKPVSRTVEDYRPITLINTDQKILSHLLANRLKKSLTTLVGPHQTAYLPQRSIHSSLTHVNLNLEYLTEEDCLVACDFSKAFDKLDRTYLFALLQQIGLHPSTLGLIKLMYHHTDAFLDINGSLSPVVNITSGVRQGCPLSSLLFILGLEPFLFHLQRNTAIQSSSPFKIIAYADDITCCLKINSLQYLFDTINIFSSVTNLYLNQQKTEILCSSSLPSGFLSVPTVQILGVQFSITNSAIQLNSAILQANQSRLFCNPYNTFLARAKNVDTFVIQKLIHQIRHKYVLKTQLERIDNIFVDSIWLGRKHNMKKTILQKPWASMGIGLKNFTQVITAAKTIDYKNFFYSNPTSNQYRLFRNSKLFSNMRRLLRTFNCTLSLDNTSQILLRRSSQVLVLTSLTRTRTVYRFLSSTNTHDSLLRLTQIASRLNYPPDQIFMFLRRLWKHKSYAAFEKNYLYQFFMNCYMDKIVKFEHGWTETPFCCFCGSATETFHHLLSECPNIPHLNFFPTVGHPQLNFHLPNDF